VIPYLGLLPLLLGLRAAWRAWRERHTAVDEIPGAGNSPAVLSVAVVTFANGGDNIGLRHRPNRRTCSP
jgi:cadmium resistance protein CadD (predicted permease)